MLLFVKTTTTIPSIILKMVTKWTHIVMSHVSYTSGNNNVRHLLKKNNDRHESQP